MRPFLSGSGTSNQRTRMLLEVVAKADTLVGPQEGTVCDKDRREALCLNGSLFRCVSCVFSPCDRLRLSVLSRAAAICRRLDHVCSHKASVIPPLPAGLLERKKKDTRKEPLSCLALIPGHNALIPENLQPSVGGRWVGGEGECTDSTFRPMCSQFPQTPSFTRSVPDHSTSAE